MEHARQTILDLEQRLAEIDAEANKIKSAINCLCDVIGDSPKYLIETEDSKNVAGKPRPDEYYGRPQATVVTEVLQKRCNAGLGAATLDELFEELSSGGFEFTGKNDGIKKRGLAIAMGKNQFYFRVASFFDSFSNSIFVWHLRL